MKKYITAPIGSAIIIPGFGQVLNGQLKKGLILMGIVFVFFIAMVIKLTQITMYLLPEMNLGQLNSEEILARINVTDISIFKVIIFVFLIVWLYSVIDALIYGIMVEKRGNRINEKLLS